MRRIQSDRGEFAVSEEGSDGLTITLPSPSSICQNLLDKIRLCQVFSCNLEGLRPVPHTVHLHFQRYSDIQKSV